MKRERVVELLMKYNVGSVSPGIGTVLLGVLDGLNEIPVAERTKDLAAYAAALRLITEIAALHQARREKSRTLQRLINKMRDQAVAHLNTKPTDSPAEPSA